MILKTIAREKSSNLRGLGYVLANEVIKKIREAGFSYIIHAYMIAESRSNELSAAFLGKTIREYILYKKEIR